MERFESSDLILMQRILFSIGSYQDLDKIKKLPGTFLTVLSLEKLVKKKILMSAPRTSATAYHVLLCITQIKAQFKKFTKSFLVGGVPEILVPRLALKQYMA